MADGSRHDVFIRRHNQNSIKEWIRLKYVGCTVNLNRNTLVSEVIVSNRQTSDVLHGTQEVAGDIIGELNAFGFEILLDSLMGGAPIYINQASPPNLRWNIGVERRPFDLIRRYADTTDSYGELYKYYEHVEVNSANITITPDAITKTTFTLLGKNMELLTINSRTEIDDNNTEKALRVEFTHDEFDFVDSLNEGKSITAFKGDILTDEEYFDITELQINITNNLESRYRVGSKLSLLPAIGRADVTGQLTAYFQNKTLYKKFLDEKYFRLVVELRDDLDNVYKITMPRVKFNTAQTDVNNEGPIIIPLSYQALESNDKTITIDRLLEPNNLNEHDVYIFPPYMGPI